ncbi:helix-hairpin-helix domain-containing protein [bacterium]|nr:MAG: helix-hairpin-helix domain-containing protein [bacterium]
MPPSSLKILLLFLALGTAFLFRTETEREEERLVSIAELPSDPVTPSSIPLPAPSASVPVTETLAEKVDLNSATVERIESLPGVGPKLAGEIVAYRERGGMFHSAEDLLQVKGIGPKRLHRLEPYLTFGSNDKR